MNKQKIIISKSMGKNLILRKIREALQAPPDPKTQCAVCATDFEKKLE